MGATILNVDEIMRTSFTEFQQTLEDHFAPAQAALMKAMDQMTLDLTPHSLQAKLHKKWARIETMSDKYSEDLASLTQSIQQGFHSAVVTTHSPGHSGDAR